MWDRRTFLTRGLPGALGLAGTSLALPGDNAKDKPVDLRDRIPDGSASRGMITAKTEQAIRRGLAYLSARREKNTTGPGSYFGTGGYKGNVAVTSLAAMAYMCAGYQPQRGAHGKIITDALKFVMSKENTQGGHPGYLHNHFASPHGPMYGHGFATLFLSEVYGMVHDKALRDKLRGTLHRAVKLILDAQQYPATRRWPVSGGWRYTPTSIDADISVTVCQIMALRSARNVGIKVPKNAVDLCTKYVKACRNSEGSFRYTIHGRRGPGGQQGGFARTAAGVCALNAAGIYSGKEVTEGLKYLLKNKPGAGYTQFGMHYFYGHYYAVQAMWTAGGSYWTEWYPAIRDELLNRQSPDGSWMDQICSHYGTAMACIILQVPNNFLPILQK